jgi:hypothetical protein
MTVITVFGRHGCHLCDVAVEVLEGMHAELNFEIEKIYIDGNVELEKGNAGWKASSDHPANKQAQADFDKNAKKK